jgi:hypothetical protein
MDGINRFRGNERISSVKQTQKQNGNVIIYVSYAIFPKLYKEVTSDC